MEPLPVMVDPHKSLASGAPVLRKDKKDKKHKHDQEDEKKQAEARLPRVEPELLDLPEDLVHVARVLPQ